MKRVITLLACIVAGLAVPGCNLVVDTSLREPCQDNADCATGQCQLQTCVLALEPECTTNADCTGLPFCMNQRCIADPRTDDCQEIVPAGALERNAGNKILIGFLGALDSGYGTPTKEGAQLALEEIEETYNGVPGAAGEGRRHVAMLVCNEEGASADHPVEVAEHLALVAKVPVIIGASFSGDTMRVFEEVTKKNNVLLISPSATSPAITDATQRTLMGDPDDLMWRTSPSDVAQAELLKFLVVDVDNALGLPDERDIVVTVKGDPAGTGLQKAVANPFESPNPAPPLTEADTHVRLVNYPNTVPPEAEDWSDEVQAILRVPPRIIMALGTLEFVSFILPGVEQQWPATAPRPWYLLPEGCRGPELVKYALDNPGLELHDRVLGTAPGARQGVEFQRFTGKFKGKFGQREPGNLAEFGYDTAYLILYSLAVTGRPFPTGPELAQGLTRLSCRDSGGTSIVTGSDGFEQYFGAAAVSGACLDFRGASGPVNFDQHGETSADIATWCLRPAGADLVFNPPLDKYYSAAELVQRGDLPNLTAKDWCPAPP